MRIIKKAFAIKFKKFFYLLMVMVVTITLFSGCWDRQETDELSLVGSIALDKLSEDKVLVSLEILNPGALARGLELAGTQNVVGWVMREEASTVPNAILNIQRRVPHKIFVGQVNTIILGQNFAREGGIIRHLEYFATRTEIRRSIFLATCDSANNLLQRPFMEELPSLTLEGLARQAAASGKSVDTTLNEFLLKLSEPGIEPITMHVAGRKTKDVKLKPQGEEIRQESPAETPEQPLDSEINIPGMLPPDHPSLNPLREAGTGETMEALTPSLGIAAFKGDRLMGFLDGNDARGYLWVVGRMPRGGFIEIPDPFNDSGVLGIKIIRVVSSMKPVVKDEKVSMKVEVQLDLELLHLPTNIDTAETEAIDIIKGEVNSFVKNEIGTTLRIVQKEYQSDIYGFGQALYWRNPRLWQQLSEDWNEEVFPEMEVDVSVRSRVRSSGAIIRRSR